jgi:hypothetical protein
MKTLLEEKARMLPSLLTVKGYSSTIANTINLPREGT